MKNRLEEPAVSAILNRMAIKGLADDAIKLNDHLLALNLVAVPQSTRPEEVAFDTVKVQRNLLLSMGTDHVISGGPGPLFGAGWAAACEHWSKKLLQEQPSPLGRTDAAGERLKETK